MASLVRCNRLKEFNSQVEQNGFCEYFGVVGFWFVASLLHANLEDLLQA